MPPLALIEFAFERLRVRRIVATTVAQNQASINVMRRVGMAIHHNAEPGWPQVVGCCYRMTG